MLKVEYKEIVSHLHNIIKGSDFEGHVYVVGGAVRSEIMDHNIKDIDLVVDLPNGGINFANWLKECGHVSGSVVVYPTYGTAMFKLDKFKDHEIEVVQTRKEQYKDKNSRNPETEYGTIEEDAMRRDLTINALYYNISTKEYLDITGNGYQDIFDHLIRVTSNPEIVFHDDALRILRCIRFATRFDYTIDANTMSGMMDNAHRLSTITTERITDEFNKILMSGNAWKGLEMLYNINAFQHIFRSRLEIAGDFVNKDSWSHTHFKRLIYLIKDRCRWVYSEDRHPELYANEIAIRLAILFQDTLNSDLKALLYGMRYPKDTIDLVLKLNDAVDFIYNEVRYGDDDKHKTAVRKFEHKFGYPCCCNAMDIVISNCKCEFVDTSERLSVYGYNIAQKYQNVREDIWHRMYFGETMIGYQPPIDGNLIMEIKNIGPGRDVKTYYNLVMEEIYKSEHPTKITREDCIEMLNKINLKSNV